VVDNESLCRVVSRKEQPEMRDWRQALSEVRITDGRCMLARNRS